LPVPTDGSKLPPMVGAVIYVRVSTKEQTENLSLPTQLRACEEYCRRQGYEVVERFYEEGESAKTTDRSQLQNLLTYCRLNKGRVHFVVVFNLTRFARDKYDHFALRSLLQSLGISLRSATEPIDDTSTGKLMEGVLAAFAQFDNDCRSDRTRAGMRAALELGRWTFLAPIGYLNAPRAMGKSLMADPERAPLVRRAFEEYATGRFTKQQVLEQARAWGLTNRRNRPLTSQAIGVLLSNQLYAGIVDVPEYGVRAKRGDFEPLISEDLFYQVQSVLSVARRAPRHSSGRTRTSHYAPSCAASPVVEASPAAGRRAAASTTPTTTAGLAAAPSTSPRPKWKISSPTDLRACNQSRLREHDRDSNAVLPLAASTEFVDCLESTGDQRLFFGLGPAFELTLSAKSCRHRTALLRVDELNRTSQRGVHGPRPGVVRLHAPGHVTGSPNVQTAVCAAHDIYGFDPGHGPYRACHERAGGNERWCPSTRQISGSLRTPFVSLASLASRMVDQAGIEPATS